MSTNSQNVKMKSGGDKGKRDMLFLLLAGVDQGLSEVKSVTQYMGSGFLDMTRIAGSNPRMMLDILLTNRQHVMTGLACVEEMIIKIRQLLMSEQTDVLEKMLTVQMRKRRRYPVSGETE